MLPLRSKKTARKIVEMAMGARQCRFPIATWHCTATANAVAPGEVEASHPDVTCNGRAACLFVSLNAHSAWHTDAAPHGDFKEPSTLTDQKRSTIRIRIVHPLSSE